MRVNALVMRKHIEKIQGAQNSKASSSASSSARRAQPERWFSLTAYLRRQGWDSLATYTDYTRGFTHMKNVEERSWFPHEAITRSVQSTNDEE